MTAISKIVLITATLTVAGTKAFSMVPPLSTTSTGTPLSFPFVTIGGGRRHTFLPSTLLHDATVILDPAPEDPMNTPSKKTALPVATKRSPAKKGHIVQNGVFSPLVYAMKIIMGEDGLNKLRGKAIATHTDVISKFVTQEPVLSFLYRLADCHGNECGIDYDEFQHEMVDQLGFSFLNDVQLHKIFEKLDEDHDGYISLEEWIDKAPKTLRTNMIKLAKKNGSALGLLV